MASLLKDKRIVLGVTGSIACYKAADLASKLTQEGALVDVVMTNAAQEFIAPLTFTSLTHRPTITAMFDHNSPQAIQHVFLAHEADILVIAPATANVIAKLTHGLADDMLTATALATRAPILIAPAMDANMYEAQPTQENVDRLRCRGVTIVGPAVGRMASGHVGRGRMVEVSELVETILIALGRNGDLAGRHIVVTAGGTQEPLDPVRAVTNRSSGKMGYAIAQAARDRGASVILISAPTALPAPVGVQVINIMTAAEMRDAVSKAVPKCDALIMAAAVADYRPAKFSQQKLKKGDETWSLEMVKTADILNEVQGNFVKVGFAAETENVLENAREKLAKKHLHLIVANDVTDPEGGFASDRNRVILVDDKGGVETLPLLSKYEVAHHILDKVVKLITSR